MRTSELFDLSHTRADKLLSRHEYPWQALGEIGEFVKELGKSLDAEIFSEVSENVWIAKNAKIYPSACIEAPCIIGENTEVRHCAFIRGKVIIGDGCVIGNSCEIKNSIIFDGVQIPHYNYVGDSVLGYKSHLGAGSVTSNLKSDKSDVVIKYNGKEITTGLRKIGAMVGDLTEVGCNSVLCPGCILGKNCTVYPVSRVRGVIPENSIFKAQDNIVKKH